MSKAMVNLTLSVVDQEIETTLENCSDVSCQRHFSNPYWRQKLVAYVLRRIPGTYAVIEETESLVIDSTMLEQSTPEMSQIIELVRQGIQQLSAGDGMEAGRSPQSLDSTPGPPLPELSSSPSTWFG